MVELMKAYNKMHDPKTDGAIQAFNFCGDDFGCQYSPQVPLSYWNNRINSAYGLYQLLNKQANVGRCQYGISLEGEELGTDKMMVTGRKTEHPCSLLVKGTKTVRSISQVNIFVRADWILYIRPDLQVVVLGK